MAGVMVVNVVHVAGLRSEGCDGIPVSIDDISLTARRHFQRASKSASCYISCAASQNDWHALNGAFQAATAGVRRRRHLCGGICVVLSLWAAEVVSSVLSVFCSSDDL